MSTAEEGGGKAPRTANKPKKTETPPAPAPILGTGAVPQSAEARAAIDRTPEGVLIDGLRQNRADLAARFTLLAAVAQAAVLVSAQLRLFLDGDVALAREVEERIAVLRRAKADAAGVPREDAVERHVVLRPKSMRWLPVPLSAEDHQAARLDHIAKARRVSDAKAAEAARSGAAKAEIKQLEAELAEALELAHGGKRAEEVEVEERIFGRRIDTVRLDTGEVIDQRRATDAEVEDASQIPLWGT